jgi:Phytanoyl-CoA dioxygenase (PhyH)
VGTPRDQADRLQAQGWLVVRAAVAAERVRELEAAVDAIRAACPEVAPGAVWELASPSRLSHAIARHVLDGELGRHAAAALGCARVQLLQDTALVKPARVGGEVAWHQDHTYTGYLEPPRLVSLQLALTASTVENGGLEVLDGSHRDGLSGEVRALAAERVVETPLAHTVREDRIVPVELAPGDVSLHHCLTLHRSRRNRSDGPRKILITRIVDAACRIVPERLPPGAVRWFPTDGDGHLDPAAFPLLNL